MSYERNGGEAPEMGEEAGFRGRRRSSSRSPPRRRSRSRSRSPYGGGRSRRDRSYSPPRGGGRSPPRYGYRDRGPPPPPRDYPPPPYRGGYDDRYHHPRDYPAYDYPPRGPPPPHHYNAPPFDYRGGPPPPPHHRMGPPPPFRRDRSPRRGPSRREEGPPGVSLLVRNIGTQVTTADLSHAFGRIGELRDVYIPRDYHTNAPRGFAFVEFADPRQAAEARDEMDRFVIKGRELEVVFAQERRKTPGEMKERVVNQQNRGDEKETEHDRDKERDRDEADRPERERSNSNGEGSGTERI